MIGRLVLRYLSKKPQVAIQFLQQLGCVPLKAVPTERISPPSGFEDLAWLFNSNKANRGIARLNFDEAAYLFKIIKSLSARNILEIGRFTGGSTIVLATAAGAAAKIDSVDKTPQDDATLSRILKTLQLEKRINLIADDANNLPVREESYDLIFIDGDHSYEGVSKDYLRWRKALKNSGHLVFHDYEESEPGVIKLVDEVRERDRKHFREVRQVGSLVHFKKEITR